MDRDGSSRMRIFAASAVQDGVTPDKRRRGSLRDIDIILVPDLSGTIPV